MCVRCGHRSEGRSDESGGCEWINRFPASLQDHVDDQVLRPFHPPEISRAKFGRGVEDPVELSSTSGLRGIRDVGDDAIEHPRRDRFEIAERIDRDGTVRIPLEDAAVATSCRIAERGIMSVAICFPYSRVDDAHERRAVQIFGSTPTSARPRPEPH